MGLLDEQTVINGLLKLSGALRNYGTGVQNRLSGLLQDPAGTVYKALEQQQAPFIKSAARDVYRLDAVTGSDDTRNSLKRAEYNAAMGMVGPSAVGKVAPIRNALSEADRAGRMAAMGMERGWFRGGPEPVNGKRTGPWYTQDAEEAANYAQRFGDRGDVREYAIPAANFLNADKGYSSRLAHDVADVVSDPYFGKAGAHLAKELRTYGPQEQIPGYALWQALESRFGNDGAAAVIERIGAFNGVKGITGGPEAYVFTNAPVRDARLAGFDPAKRTVDDIYGRATVPAMLGSAGLGLLGLEALRSNRASE